MLARSIFFPKNFEKLHTFFLMRGKGPAEQILKGGGGGGGVRGLKRTRKRELPRGTGGMPPPPPPPKPFLNVSRLNWTDNA